MALNYKPVQPGKHVRVWLALRGFGPDESPRLEGYVVPDQVSMNQTVDVVTKKVPSATRRGAFDIAYTVTQRSDPEITTSLINRLPADMRSMFLKLVNSGCKFDMAWAYGVCSDPNRYNEFDKVELFEGVSASNYSHDQTGALDDTTQTDDVLENVELTIERYYDHAPVAMRIAVDPGADTLTDILIGDTPSCGSDDGCTQVSRSDGAQKVFAISGDGIDLTLHYSKDSGVTFDTETFAGIDEGGLTRLAYVGGYLVVFYGANAGGGLVYQYADAQDVVDGVASWTTVGGPATGAATGLNTFSTETAAYVTYNTNVYYLTASNIANGPTTVTTSGPASPIAIHEADGRVVVLSATAGAIIDEDTYIGPVTSVPANTKGIHMFDRDTWLISAGTGLYLTRNGGESNVQTNTFAGNVGRIRFNSRAVGYLDTANGLYATANGGNTWYLVDAAVADGDSPRVEVADNGNFVMVVDTDDVVHIGEDKLRRIYGSF